MPWCWRLRAQLDQWADDPAITRVVIQAAGEPRLLGRRRHPPSLRSRQGRPARRGAAILARRISAQRGDQELPQALRGADRRHRHGRRRRRLGARLASRRRRPLPVRHAGSRHRLFSRRRRDLVPAAPAGRTRHLLRADRRALRRRRRVAPPALPPTAFPRRAFRRCSTALAGTVVGRCGAGGLRGTGGRGADHGAARRRSTACSPATASRTSSPRSTAKPRPAAPMPNGPARPPPPCGRNRRSA